ncbi:MAG: acyl-ACP--UDP-N-acetylglucosamine O-acyltransferase [Lentisphaeraceae bacterium]|nr:acyl-ACP--UDP-N-acetylglucosamine O-acyltransferase [Lentisphaeraceae bacterium]
MASEIDKLAVVHPKAKIGNDCYIGPFCTISENAVIGDRTSLQSHVVVDGNTTIGSDCRVFPFASIGTQSQDLKWLEGNKCYTEVGNSTIIREYVTIHAGTDDGTKTSVGDHCALLALSHVGHNCEVGNHVVLSHSATLGGHVIVGDHANIGGLSAVHQFCHIGRNAMIAGMARVIQDVLPFTIAEGAPAHMRIINKIGMERNGYSKDEITVANKCYRILFMRDLKLDAALQQIEDEFEGSEVAKEVLEFARTATRGLARK